MEELIKALEQIQGRVSGICDEQSLYEIETENQVGAALYLAREHAAKVDMLHDTITGNLEHAIAAWLVTEAETAEQGALDPEQVESDVAATLVMMMAAALRVTARKVKDGTWKS